MVIKTKFGLDVSVSIERNNGNAVVTVHAPMYVNKQWTFPIVYSDAFTDEQITNDNDFYRIMVSHYGDGSD